MVFTFSARQLAIAFVFVVSAFVLMHVALQIVRFATGDHSLMGLLAVLSLGSDLSFPSFYSAVAILFTSALLGVIALAERRTNGYRPMYWCVLSAIFLFLSVDEMLALHERLDGLVAGWLEVIPALNYGRVVPYGAAVVVFALAYSRFLFGLPRRTCRLLLLSGAIFFGGAVGLEQVAGFIAGNSGTLNMPYVVFRSIGEILEMAGIVLLIFALADYAESHFGGITLRLEALPAQREETAGDEIGLDSDTVRILRMQLLEARASRLAEAGHDPGAGEPGSQSQRDTLSR